MHTFTFTIVSALALFGAFVQAFWRLECQGNSGLARYMWLCPSFISHSNAAFDNSIDPLMAYNTIGDHVHSIKGGSGKPHFTTI